MPARAAGAAWPASYVAKRNPGKINDGARAHNRMGPDDLDASDRDAGVVASDRRGAPRSGKTQQGRDPGGDQRQEREAEHHHLSATRVPSRAPRPAEASSA